MEPVLVLALQAVHGVYHGGSDAGQDVLVQGEKVRVMEDGQWSDGEWMAEERARQPDCGR